VKQVGGFITIGKLFDDSWNWYRFWNMTAFLSIILAVMNILPIPALDGGHVMFLLYEMISGRQPNQKVLEYAQLAGIAILLTLLIYANGMDIFRLIK
jgi:regulator of sigma E protease